MEKTIKCAECGKDCTYNVPIGRTDNRKYCFKCSAVKKAQWESKDAPALLPSGEPNPTITESEKISGKVESSTQYTKPSREKSIVAQCLTKCLYTNRTTTERKQLLEAYNYFLENL